MKKTALSLILTVAAIFTMSARDTFSRNITDLPAAAQATLSQFFKAKLSLIKIEKVMGRVSQYEVILDDGTEIDFDHDGKWSDIEVRKGKKVPDNIVPKSILNYIKTNHKNKKIIGIEKSRNEYEVELENGVELKFDRSGNFRRYNN